MICLACTPSSSPKYKVFGNAEEVILNGLKQYVGEVKSVTFPAPENWFGMPDAGFEELKSMLD
jgi:ketopantoate hydroxymethyltransferase